jgi:DNA mismatch repair protein MutS2
MNSSASFTLDFDKVRAVLAGLTGTAKGRNLAETLEPSSRIEVVRRRLDETSEAKRLAEDNARLALESLPEVESELQDLGIEGRVLGVESFLRLATASAVVLQTRRALLARKEEAPLLASRAESLPNLAELEADVRRIIDPETETVRDDASRELERIREKSRKLDSRLGKLLDQTLSSRDNQKLLQESLVTSRNNRPVVPIKAECKSQFPGIVHGASASGATLFVEPLATVEVNNEIAVVRDREREEIRKILAELTERVRPRRGEVALAAEILAEIDLAQAKGRLSEICRGEAPDLTEESELRLENARHPLLIPEFASRAGLPRDGAGAVPLTFGLAEGRRGLVFTGPNTGGKTVALKTAGLLSLMTQAGLHVPARSSSVFPIFQSIFADIGDDQSIGSSLSTFSSHLGKVVSMERELELPALVILDEVGTGTDPAEGGALGTALVEHFLERGAMVLASTHHGLLKAYALTHEGIGAASFEFDPRTYAPTYRIVEGAAGRSLAFEMATLLGLPRSIVDRARALESERERQVGELVSRLEAESAEIAQERIRLAEDRKVAEESRRRLEEREEEERLERRRRLTAFRASLEEEVDSTRRELKDVVAEAKRAIAEIRDSRQEDRALLSELEKTLSDRIEASTAPLLEKARAETPKDAFPVSPDAIRPGTRVLVASFGMEGIVERIAGDEAEVVVRDKKLKLPVSSLEALPPLAPPNPASAAKPGRGATTFTTFPGGKQMAEELNLIGCTVDEALSQADKFLDDALLSEYRHVRLIHGHGTGRLKSALREWLSAHPKVEKLESDSRGGVTVVELKD